MNIKDKRGSITIFVLFGLLFMSAYLMISYANNLNKSKFAKEQFSFISSIYSHGDGIANSYTRFVTNIRKKNKQTLTASSVNKNLIELTRTYNGTLSNLIIFGSTDEDNKGNIGVGTFIDDQEDINYGKYRLQIIVFNQSGERKQVCNIYLPYPLLKASATLVDYIDFKNKKVVYEVGFSESEPYELKLEELEEIETYEDFTRIQVQGNAPSKIEVEYTGYKID